MATPILGIEEIGEASAVGDQVANKAFRILEAFADRILQSLVLTAPPGSPASSACYYVASSPTGAWAGQAGKVACYVGSQWVFWAVKTGHRYYNVATTATVTWNGSAWV